MKIYQKELSKINAYLLHDKDIFFMYKSSIPSIVKTLNKFLILRDIYYEFSFRFYEEIFVKPIIEQFFFVKQRLEKLEHPALITERTHNIDTDSYP